MQSVFSGILLKICCLLNGLMKTVFKSQQLHITGIVKVICKIQHVNPHSTFSITAILHRHYKLLMPLSLYCTGSIGLVRIVFIQNAFGNAWLLSLSCMKCYSQTLLCTQLHSVLYHILFARQKSPQTKISIILVLRNIVLIMHIKQIY